ncbi:hypothetical protein BABINDRAFT_30660 [Babjeviella inositovora NRRL Y-12698]|uniref:S-adenosyl-L-methionine-dependent tRNA 4-demethylwyosine synthase n=1 Tax=Babjeviella inositovora NRRL Y-12698 TaxID=984486 RepID=A0A1E3QZ00_9ASCO|nr:uncharacterized protein BABINDRAFT_30660 [Babjeviella inositovora NRRL Y-12698]ODQ82851.1 hypothetical protein BABINDRAFT_30660 [Babjeviella inositovora NRRL Y-12698]
MDFTSAFQPKTPAAVNEALVAAVAGVALAPVPLKKAKRAPKVFKATAPVKTAKPAEKTVMTKSNLMQSNYIIFYSSLTGSSLRAAKDLGVRLAELGIQRRLMSLDDDVDDLDEYFQNTPKAEANSAGTVYVLILPSYEMDSPIDYFLETLLDTIQDFRIDSYPLAKLAGFAVLGLGDAESYPEKFCYQAKIADKYLAKLGARRIFPLGQVCMKYKGDSGFEEWNRLLADTVQDEELVYVDGDDASDEEYDYDNVGEDADTLVDVEDMGNYMASDNDTLEKKEMVAKDSPTYKTLTKQGYTIVGSHSGVKLCRWTKSALRGRGSCYKYAFYGIQSHLCMETTPSLACSNKCVFCWRHGTNPVARDKWRWELDSAQVVFDGAKAGHYSKIKQMRGVPGVQADRFAEAFQIRHCALSLVGEPIFYPYINDFVELLHNEDISSFLVCNAQHPEQLAAMSKVTQLYVSIDAPTKDSLKKVDRPLNRDFWERLNKCLDILRTTQADQRTVFRLTLVKDFNMEDINEYAELVERGRPSQIEIKGATFCGSSAGNGNPLTMQNIPFYEECKNFVEALTANLQARGLPYEISAEHAHSCCILVADTKFKIGGKWFTHIDYKRFFELLKSGKSFNDMDYVAETPEWAYYGSKEGGFRPDDVKWNRTEEKLKNKKAREAQAEAQASKIEEVSIEGETPPEA